MPDATTTHQMALIAIGMAGSDEDASNATLIAGTLPWYEEAYERVNGDAYEDAPVSAKNASLIKYFGYLCAVPGGRMNAWHNSGGAATLARFKAMPMEFASG